MLREARIVMPHTYTSEAEAAHEKLRARLCEAFGGYTAFIGTGGWRSPTGTVVKDDVVIYDVAMDGHRGGFGYDALAKMAVDAGRALGQESVYVRYCNGTVDIIDIKSFVERANHTAREKAEKEQRLLNELARDDVEHKGDDDLDEAALIRMLEAIFGKGNVAMLDNKERIEPEPTTGQRWATRGGGEAYVGRKITIHGGGFYTTLVMEQPGYRVGFEYAVGPTGRLDAEVETSLDLVSRTA